jgi:hypothetical protein
VIGTKFPSYFARHPNKVAWLIHQYRAAYELCGTEYSDFAHTELDVGLRDTLMRLDTEMLGECRALFTNARNTASRLAKFRGLQANRLSAQARGSPGSGPTRTMCCRWPHRVGQAGESRHCRHGGRPLDIRLVIAGDGTQRQNAERAAARPVTDRVTFLGNVEDDDLIALCAGAGCGVSAADEDFGYVTLEAFLARKPVITCNDSGGPNEFVIDGVNGFVRSRAGRLAITIDRLAANRSQAAKLGDAGYETASAITWTESRS